MSEQIYLLLHPTFGVLGIIAAVWVFVATFNVTHENVGRIRLAAKTSAVMIWLAFIVAGYFYVVYYGGDKAIIKAGPWPWAHSFFMENKEHMFFMVLVLATFLPIATSGPVDSNRGVRKVVMWSAAFVVLIGLAMEGAGAIIGMGVKVALLAQMG
ncbi:hypothetical protein [Profundibacter sp.]|uniref:hypothetical protein n=1 Tax=Profundibacter sp. TaxID=3101071 RepID=UPI003D0B6C9D